MGEDLLGINNENVADSSLETNTRPHNLESIKQITRLIVSPITLKGFM